MLGLPGQSARELVETRGLMFVVGEEREDVKTPAGTVVAQKPLQGSRIERGQRVEVVLAKPPGPVKMPGLAGLELADAKARIEAAKLALGKVTEENSEEVKAGSVISQVPAAGGEAKAGTAVDLVVSKGEATIAVPQVVGRSLFKAKAELVKAGFTVGTVRSRYDEDHSDGLVLEQNPAAEQQATKGSAVELIVNRTD